ncbi:uncharacterized protein LOC128546017 [Mercenaria mercenaria]|uniref:uncharacterized protein LOC128546017 n=1 Tax=Mercenaria mercenaria TaxID=6596 RepID=UPI00234F8F2B|nr:uncharacterized protein LOC128546017 [Mercenaria mercenaria]XP_045208204.2 uncharacterized protein LOC128546017 [Mercenaria mercenaria]XP_045208205.2 uncharacterized protein LOC128546017 [Mercenaria mercenaria]
MEKEGCITLTHSPRRATKAATVNALSLKKKKNVCEDKAEQLQGSITRGRSMKHRKEKRPDDCSGVRQTCRRVKLKKCEDFVYGNTKVATYKQMRNNASITKKHTLKSLNKEKYKPVDAFNQNDEHVTKGHHESSRGKKVQTGVKKGVTRSKDVSLISEKNESFVDNSEVCARKCIKRKLTVVDESEESANEIAAIKGYRNRGRNNLKNSNKGKIAKHNENHLRKESMVKRDSVTENEEMVYSRNSNKTKIQKQKYGTKMADNVKGKTSEKSGNKRESDTSSYGVGTFRVDELDKDKEKHEIATNVEDIGRKRTIRGKSKNRMMGKKL